MIGLQLDNALSKVHHALAGKEARQSGFDFDVPI